MDNSISLLKKDYNRLALFYDLPPFDVFNSEFELIASVDYEGFFLEKYLLRVVLSRLQSYINILSSILEPTSNLVDFPESHVFNEEELKELQNLFRKIMYYARSFNYNLFFNNPSIIMKDLSLYLIKDHTLIRTGILNVLSKIKSHWVSSDKVIFESESIRYFG